MKEIRTSFSTGVPMGTIIAFALSKDNIPADWLLCDGSEIPAKYQELITLLGSNKTPLLSGLTLIGSGSAASGSSYNLGQTGGEEKHQLSLDEMPSHSHEISYQTDCSGTGCSDADQIFCSNKPGYSGHYTGSQGGDKAHNNMQPYYAVNYIMYAGN